MTQKAEIQTVNNTTEHELSIAPHTSVVMVSYHTGPVLWLSIESVLRQVGLKELIIVDNGNNSDTLNRLKAMARRYPDLTLITGHGNIGFAAGCNKGADYATGEYLLLLNPDCLLPHNALQTTVLRLRKSPDVWLAGCDLVSRDGSEQAGGRRNLLTPWRALVEGLKLYKLAPNHPYFDRLNLHEQVCAEEKSGGYSIPAISGAFMAISKAHFRQVNGMDAAYFLHVEDLDFCYRIRQAGGDIVYQPDVRVVHYRSTSEAPTMKVEWHKARGFIRYFHTHFYNAYPRPFLWLVDVGACCRFAVRSLSSIPLSIKQKFVSRDELQSERRHMLLQSYSSLPESEVKNIPHSMFIAGATGQVGVSVMRRLLRAGHTVHALRHRHGIDADIPTLKWHDGSLQDDTLPDIPAFPDTYIQTAAIWLLPKHIPELARRGVRRIICFSSTSVFSKKDSGNPHEQALSARFMDAENEIDRLCDAHGIMYTIFRPTLIYGVGLDKNVCSIARFIKRFGFFPLAYPGTGKRQPVHTDDLAQAVCDVLQNPVTYNKCYNLSGAEVLTYKEMVARIFGLLGMPQRIIGSRLLPWTMDMVAHISGRVDLNGEIARRMNQDLVFSYGDAKKDFDYCPRKFMDIESDNISGNLFL